MISHLFTNHLGVAQELTQPTVSGQERSVDWS